MCHVGEKRKNVDTSLDESRFKNLMNWSILGSRLNTLGVDTAQNVYLTQKWIHSSVSNESIKIPEELKWKQFPEKYTFPQPWINPPPSNPGSKDYFLSKQIAASLGPNSKLQTQFCQKWVFAFWTLFSINLCNFVQCIHFIL